MVAGNKLFENFFSDGLMTSPRLYAFANDTIGRLTAANSTKQFDVILGLILPTAKALGLEIGDVKSSVNVRLGKTFVVNDVIARFKTYMSDNEGVIAKAIGGKQSAAFLVFYPHGITEYSKANKTTLPSLLIQVTKAANLYTAKLGAALTNELLAFDDEYEAAHNAQQEQKGKVVYNRIERTANRTALEMALLVAIHTIGAMYPGNVEKGTSFFDFNLLMPLSRTGNKVEKLVTP